MRIIRCDICNNEMTSYIFDRDSETQYYTLIKKYGGRELETDICNGCMHKLIDFVKEGVFDIVRCVECCYKDSELCSMDKMRKAGVLYPYDFCSKGERSE